MKNRMLGALHTRIVLLISIVVLLILVIPFVMTTLITSQVDEMLASDQKRTQYSFDLSLARIDIPKSLATLTMTPRFTGEMGEPTSNGSLSFKDVELLVDSFQGNSTFSAEIGQVLGRQEFEILLKGNSWRYPFDRYTAAVSLWDAQFGEGLQISVIEKNEYLPGFLTNSNTVPGYTDQIYPENASKKEKIEYDLSRGQLNVSWNIYRLPGDIYFAILLAILMLISAFASVAVSRAVWSGQRPPSINTLAWLAAFLFAMFQIRASLPGNPPNGTLFDLLIFYPILILLLTEMAVVVYLWIKRDDWDLKNPRTPNSDALELRSTESPESGMNHED